MGGKLILQDPMYHIGYGNVFINSDCDGAENVENEEI